MFTGEFESLTALSKTGTIRVPKPIKVILDVPSNVGSGAMIVMEFLDNLGSMRGKDKELGIAVAG